MVRDSKGPSVETGRQAEDQAASGLPGKSQVIREHSPQIPVSKERTHLQIRELFPKEDLSKIRSTKTRKKQAVVPPAGSV